MKKILIFILLASLFVNAQTTDKQKLQVQQQQKKKEEQLYKTLLLTHDSLTNMVSKTSAAIAKAPDDPPPSDPIIILKIKRVPYPVHDTLRLPSTCTIVMPKPDPPPVKNVLRPAPVQKKKVLLIFSKKIKPLQKNTE